MSASRYTIALPESQAPAMTAVASLSEDSFERLVSGLAIEPAIASLTDLVGVVDGLGVVDPPGPRDIVEALIGAVGAAHWRSVDDAQVAESISRSEVLDLGEDQRAVLAERLLILIRTRTIEVLGKAIDVATEHERIFLDGRILTDVRPVFLGDQTDQPAGAVLVHTLRVDYHEAGHRRSFFVAMDAADLEQLRKVISRAVDKTASVRGLVTDAGLPIVDLEDA